jgi:hypothetical protein
MQDFKFIPVFNRDYLYYKVYIKTWWGWKKLSTVSQYDLTLFKEKLKDFKAFEEKI